MLLLQFQKIVNWTMNKKTLSLVVLIGIVVVRIYSQTDAPLMFHSKQNYTYNTQNKLIEKIYQFWGETEQWVNYRRYTSTYDTQDNLTENSYQEWTWVEQWADIWKYTYTYDDNNNATTGIYQGWEDTVTLLMFYNNMQSCYSFYDDFSLPHYYYKFTTTYKDATTAIPNPENTNPKNKITLYPNPVSNILHIETDNTGNIPEVKIYSIQGILLINTTGNQIDVSLLPSGVYIVEINGVYQKIVKQ